MGSIFDLLVILAVLKFLWGEDAANGCLSDIALIVVTLIGVILMMAFAPWMLTVALIVCALIALVAVGQIIWSIYNLLKLR